MFGINLASLPWRWIGIGLTALMVALAIRAYGNARYEAGVVATDAAWKAAAEKLQEQSDKAGEDADLEAAMREADFAKQLEDEKGKIDEAVRSGSSPLDVLFGVQDGKGSDKPAP